MLGILGLLGVAFAGMLMVPAVRSGPDEDDTGGANEEWTEEERLPTIPLGQLEELSAAHEPGQTPEDMLGVEDNDPGVLPVRTETAGTNASGGTDDDDLTGTDNADRLDGAEGNDRLSGRGGDDELHGGAGNDRVSGDDGDDVLFGHIGEDSLEGGAGNDSLVGGDGADDLNAGAGDDALAGSFGDDTLTGGSGQDVMIGGEGDDILDGVDGEADYLNGGLGMDRLFGDAFDTLSGEVGADWFALTDGNEASSATIEDFDDDEDTLVLLFDGEGAVPVLTQEPGDDGVTILADGMPVALLRGLSEIDLGRIEQVAS